MTLHRRWLPAALVTVTVLALLACLRLPAAWADDPVVHAVYFYSPT